MAKFYYPFLVLFLACVPISIAAQCEDNSNGNTNTQPPQNIVYSTNVIISEVLPNPSTDESADEFIELYNESDEAIDITGWLLSDATTKTYTLSGSISAKHYFVVYRSDTSIALNNGGDTVELYHPNGALTDSVEYTESAGDDVSYALNDKGKWTWTTTPTPLRANTITSNSNDDASEETDQSAEDSSNTDNDNNDEATYQLSEYIQLSELLPDPSGSDATDEWIELVNTGGQPVDMYGWEVTVGDDSYLFKEVTQIRGNSYLLLPVTKTKLSLNNSGETATLVDPMGDVMDSVTYSDAPTGQSYSRSGTSWQWTVTLTPGTANVISVPVDTEVEADNTEPETTSTKGDSDTPETEVTTMSIRDAKALDSGTEVVAQGTVAVTPGVYSTTYFYMQDQTSGIQIYSTDKAFPALAIGDVIQVNGKTSISNGEERLIVDSAEDIVILSQGATLTPAAITVSTTEQYGQLVTVTGEVATVSGSTVQLDTNWEIYLKRGTEISASSFTEGSVATVTGVLIGTDDGVQVWPRSVDDVVFGVTLAAAGSNETTNTATGNITQLNNHGEQTTSSLDLAGYTAEAAPIIAKTYWPWLGLGFVVSLTLGLRAAWLNTRLRNWCVARGRAWVERYGHYVGLKKSTTDSNVPTRYHESHLSDKTLV